MAEKKPSAACGVTAAGGSMVRRELTTTPHTPSPPVFHQPGRMGQSAKKGKGGRHQRDPPAEQHGLVQLQPKRHDCAAPANHASHSVGVFQSTELMGKPHPSYLAHPSIGAASADFSVAVKSQMHAQTNRGQGST